MSTLTRQGASPHLGPGYSEFSSGTGPRSLLTLELAHETSVHYFPYLPKRQPTPDVSYEACRLTDGAEPWLNRGLTKYLKPSSLSPLHKNFPCK